MLKEAQFFSNTVINVQSQGVLITETGFPLLCISWNPSSFEDQLKGAVFINARENLFKVMIRNVLFFYFEDV